MADPMTSLFGKRAFRGTGRTQDYFPEAPDLDFLQRPTFMAPGAGYNPKLDPQALVSAGFSPRNAMVLQGFRQQAHERAGAEREFEDTRRALDGLATLDPTRKTFSKELLDIFRKNPTSMRNPEVLQQAEFISKFAGQPQWSVEDIEDPDIYQQAVKEGWNNLSPQEAKRRANSLITQRTIRGELAALGMPKTDLDKVQNWTQEDYLREKGRLVREAKGATAKPWYERLGKTAAEDVRTVAKETKALADFEDEYAKVLADNPGLTKDAYVKQFKGDPDFNSYRTRRLAEAIPSLVQEYSLTPQEAAQVLGLGGMIPQQAQAVDPWADRTTFGPSAQEAPVGAPQSPSGASLPVPPVPSAPSQPAAPVSPADLKRDDAAPVTFETLQQEVAAKAEAKRKEREAAQQAKKEEEQRIIDISTPKWEGAKQDLLQQFRPEFFKFRGDPEIKTMLASMGKTWNEKAFDDGTGAPVSWLEVGRSLLADPRVKALREGKNLPASSTPASTQQQQSLPKVESQEQFAAIPSGQWFVDSTGIPKRKK